MLEKTMAKLNEMMKILQQEVSEELKNVKSTIKGKGSTVKIKKGSTVNINGASCVMLHDTLVKTEKPDVLMGTKKS